MAVFRIEKTKDYTVMSNNHLRNTSLSLKAKGLLSLMLSLPEDWDYTTQGLAQICKDGIDSIRNTIKELEKHGYIIRKRIRNPKGQLSSIEYTIFEEPKTNLPMQENPMQVKPMFENHIQLNTNISNKDLLNTYPIQSVSTNTLLYKKSESGRIGYDDFETYRQLIKKNIAYDSLCISLAKDITMLDEIVDLITETVCSSRDYITIAGDTYPAQVVKSKFLKLNWEHIEYAVSCVKENTSDIRNIKKYMLTVLFNAPSTKDSYYTAKVNHDLLSG